MCVSVYVEARGCHVPQLFSLLLLLLLVVVVVVVTGSLTESGAWPDWPERLGDPPVSTFQVQHTTSPRLLGECWGSKLRVLCLQSKHFAE